MVIIVTPNLFHNFEPFTYDQTGIRGCIKLFSMCHIVGCQINGAEVCKTDLT